MRVTRDDRSRRRGFRRIRWSYLSTKRLAAATLYASVAMVAAVGGVFAASSRVYAGHETRSRLLSEHGLDIALIVLVLVGAVIVLSILAALIVRWERADAEAPDAARAQLVEQEKNRPSTS